jgi:hypothetical protein
MGHALIISENRDTASGKDSSITGPEGIEKFFLCG